VNPILATGALLLVGFASAVVNTLAGGGTFLAVPAMILLGYSPLTANATNRLALTVQGAGATALYRRQGRIDLRLGLRLSLIACLGSGGGAYLATRLDEEAFNRTIACLMVVTLGVLLWLPADWFARRPATGSPRPLLTGAGFLLVGIYGGFFGAGLGVFILLLLSATQRLDLVAGNAIKSLVVLFLSLVASLVFLWLGHVDLVAAVPLAVGNGLGGWLGARWSLSGGDVWIRRLLIVVVAASVYKLLG
jgi:uncharacterized membrane protein YfcA